MIISEILVRSDIASYISPLFSKPMRYLFGVSGAGAAAFLLGVLCGFPVGAKVAAALYEKGDISKADAERLMTFCNIPSAAFLIFAVGDKLFGSRALGIFLYFNTLAVTLGCAIIRNIIKKSNENFHQAELICKSNNLSLIQIFTDSVGSAAISVINVCAYVCFFTCFVGTISAVLPAIDGVFSAILFSIFELTSGSVACSTLMPIEIGIILAAVAAGWSGLSVFFQIHSLSRTNAEMISLKPYLKSKLISALFCGIFCAISVRLFPSLAPHASPDTDAITRLTPYPLIFIALINILFTLSLLFYLFKELDRRRKI